MCRKRRDRCDIRNLARRAFPSNGMEGDKKKTLVWQDVPCLRQRDLPDESIDHRYVSESVTPTSVTPTSVVSVVCVVSGGIDM